MFSRGMFDRYGSDDEEKAANSGLFISILSSVMNRLTPTGSGPTSWSLDIYWPFI